MILLHIVLTYTQMYTFTMIKNFDIIQGDLLKQNFELDINEKCSDTTWVTMYLTNCLTKTILIVP